MNNSCLQLSFSFLCRYLSTGMSFVALSQCFLMSDYTVGLIVDEVCAAIWKHLMPVHMKIPQQEEYIRIADEYAKHWNFPNVIGRSLFVK